MKNDSFTLLSSIMRHPWYMNKMDAEQYYPLIAGLMKGENVMNDNQSVLQPTGLSSSKTARYHYRDGFKNANEGSIALIDINGPLLKYDQMCADGMETMGEKIKAADKSENISKIILLIDSPGGSVDGTENLANIVKNTSKKTIGVVNGMMCSAAMWIGSQCDVIYALNDMDVIGSIGVMSSFVDVQPALEKQGVKFHEMYSELSSDKNRVSNEVLKGNYEEYIKTRLNPLADRFISTMKASRPNIEENQLSGDTYFAKDVVGSLIDGVADFDSLIEIETNSSSANLVNTGKKINSKEKRMDIQELKQNHPSLYASVRQEGYDAGVQEATAAERDRVGSYLTYIESSPEAVVEGIRNGETMSQTQMTELSLAATNHLILNAEASDNNGNTNTPKPKGQSQINDEETDKAVKAALKKQGINL